MLTCEAAPGPRLSLEDKHLMLALATKGLARLLWAVDEGLSQQQTDPTRHRLLRSSTVLALRELIDGRAMELAAGACCAPPRSHHPPHLNARSNFYYKQYCVYQDMILCY